MAPPLSTSSSETLPALDATRRAPTTAPQWLAAPAVPPTTVADAVEHACGPTVTAQDRAATSGTGTSSASTSSASTSSAGTSSSPAGEGAQSSSKQGGAWREHRVLAIALRIGVLLAPAIFASAATLTLGRVLPAPRSLPWAIARLLLILAVSGATMAAVRQATRRLLPLTALLRLSLAFPDETPKRLRLALRAPSAKQLEARLDTVSRAGLRGEPADVAAEIVTLIAAISAHHKHTRGHSERVRAYAELLGAELGLSSGERQRLRWAALLHDIGKITVPAEILDKPGKPTAEEWAVLAAHPVASARLAEPLQAWMGEWWYGIGQHHEKWNGTGYPDKLAGERISLSGRIVALADSFETMTAARSYKKPMSIADARAELVRCAGSHFDPTVVRAFLNIGNRRLRMAAGISPWLPLPLVNALLPLGQFATAASQTSVAVFAGAAAVTAITPNAVTQDPLVPVPEIAQLDREFIGRRDGFAVALDQSTSTAVVVIPADDGSGDSATTVASRRNQRAAGNGAGATRPASPSTAAPAAQAPPADTASTSASPDSATAPSSPTATTGQTTPTTTPITAAAPATAPATATTRATPATTTRPTTATTAPRVTTTIGRPATTVRTTSAPTPTTTAPKPAVTLVAGADQFTVAPEVIVIVHPLANDSGMDPATVQIMHKFPNVLSWVNPDHTVSILARKASIGSTPVIDYRICTAGWGTCRTTTITLTVAA